MRRKQRIKIKTQLLYEALGAFDVRICLVCYFSRIRVEPSSVWPAMSDSMELGQIELHGRRVLRGYCGNNESRSKNLLFTAR